MSNSIGNISGLDPTHIPLSDFIGDSDTEISECISDSDLSSDYSDSKTEVEDVTYRFPSQRRVMFIIADLVWAKVKDNQLRWPGLVMDSSYASGEAMKYYKSDAHLVVFYGNKTFAWCKDYQLKPFLEKFSEFKNQCTKDENFNKAIESALMEVSRRFAYCTFCPCLELDKKLLIKPSYPYVESNGVKEGLGHFPPDTGRIRKYFNPKGLIDFITTLALVPCEENLDKLGLVMARAQITAFKVFFRQARNSSTPHKLITVGAYIRKRNSPSIMNVDYTILSLTNGSKSNNRSEKLTNDKDSEFDSLTRKRQKINIQNEANTCTLEPSNRPVIINSKRKKSDELNPTVLQLIFSTKSGTIPSQTDLVRKFRKFRKFSRSGALKEGEIERVMEGNQIKIKICFENRADAEMACLSLRSENYFGPEVLSYKLVNVSKKQNGDDQMEKKVSGTNNGTVRPSTVSTTCKGEVEIFVDLSSKTDSLVDPNPNPNSKSERTTQVGDTFVNPNSNRESSIQSDGTSVNPDPNFNPSIEPNSSSNIQADETLANPKPNSSSTSNMFVNLDLNSNPDSNPNPKSSIFSSYWQSVEKMEVSGHILQKPHFMKLQGEKHLDYKASGLMVAYVDLVKSLPKLSFNDDLSIFEEKLATLVELEENGFIVDPIRTRLTRSIELKTEVDKHVSMSAELEKECAEREKEEKDRQVVIEELDRENKEIKKEIKKLNEVYNKLALERNEALKDMEKERIEADKEELCRLKELDQKLCENYERFRNGN